MTSRQKIFLNISLASWLLVAISIGADTLGAEKYAGMYFNYRGAVHTMQILVETDTGVDNDSDHRTVHISSTDDSCPDPPWEIRHYDYDFWPTFGIHDRPGIPGKKDRRLWAVNAWDLWTHCFYDVKFQYRDTWADDWQETWGHFHAAPRTSDNVPSDIPTELEFYALGDTRITGHDSRIDVDQTFEGLWSHEGHKTLLLHTGDIVWNGGAPVGHYAYWESEDDKDSHPDWHDNDRWSKEFLGNSDELSHVWEVLRHMPMFPALGNHDRQVKAVHGDYYDYDSNFIASISDNTYNYRRYFGGYNNGDYAEDQYYFRAWGPLLIWTLTPYPMWSDGVFCAKSNANFRPLSEGGTGQYDWLKASLEEHDTDVRQWKIVMLHTPIYDPDDGCNNQKDARTWLVPLFEKHGVDLVLTGHEHFYARKTVNDIPYLILGGGGAGLGLSDECKEDPYCHGFDLVENKHHFGHFRIRGDVMEVSILDHTNDEFDGFSVDRSPSDSQSHR